MDALSIVLVKAKLVRLNNWASNKKEKVMIAPVESRMKKNARATSDQDSAGELNLYYVS